MVKIQKEEKQVIAYVGNYVVRGKVFMPPGGRLSDFINAAAQKDFIALADAEIKDNTGRLMCRTKFLELNRTSIICLTPASELEM